VTLGGCLLVCRITLGEVMIQPLGEIMLLRRILFVHGTHWVEWFFVLHWVGLQFFVKQHWVKFRLWVYNIGWN
jgi:hypothetical protein